MSRAAKASKTRRRPSKSGGAIALAGFAYQLFGSMTWSLEVAFGGVKPAGDDLTAFTVTLEPSAGADSTHTTPIRASVMQYKTRQSGAWTDYAIVRDVVPDLFKAARPALAEIDYRFQTNAPVSLSPAWVRLQGLMRDHPLEDALTMAEAEQLVFRVGGRPGSLSARGYFEEALHLATTGGVAGPPAPDMRRHLAFVLAHLVIDDRQSAEAMVALVTERLSRVIANPEKAERARKTLLGALFEAAQQGDQGMTVAQIFEACGVPGGALKALAELEARFGAEARAALRAVNYEPSLNTRRATAIEPGAVPVALCGPSGVGKTWDLAQAAQAALDRGDLVVWIEHPASRDVARSTVARRLQAARDHSDPIHEDAVRQVVDAIAPGGRPFRISVFLDRFASPEAAVEILTDPWWAAQSIGVVGAMPAASYGDTALPEPILRRDVQDFSLPELRSYLLSRGADWTGLPSDLRVLLQRPSLAKLYADQGARWEVYQPHNEYELMTAAWSKAPTSGSQGAWTASLNIVRRRLDDMLGQILMGLPPDYPWTPQHPTAPFADPDIERLERGGLLRWTDKGGLVLDHDRLLAWGLAEAAAKRAPSGAPGFADDIAATLGSRTSASVLPGHALAYVLLDLLWNLLSPSDEPSSLCLDIVRAALSAPEPLEWPSIATLGARGFRLALAAAEQFDLADLRNQHEFVATLSQSAPDPLTVSDLGRIKGLLASTDRERRQAALSVLTTRPQSALLRQLVTRRADLYEQLEKDPAGDGRLYREWELTKTATEAIARAAPADLVRLARSELTAREASAVAYMLLDAPPTLARTRLPLLPAVLKRADAETRTRVAPLALRLDPSAGAIQAAEVCATSDGFQFEALSAVAPARAASLLQTLEGKSLRSALLHGETLLRLRPGADQSFAVRVGGHVSANDVAAVMQSWATLASPQLWQVLAEDLVTEGPRPQNDQVLRQMSGARSLALIDYLSSQRGAALEGCVAGIAERSVAAHDGRDPNMGQGLAEAVLLRIGGEAFDRLTAQRLNHRNPIEVDTGLRDALVSGAPTIIRIVEAYVWTLFQSQRGAHIPLRPVQVFCAIAPVRARKLARRALATTFAGGVLVAAEIALLTQDQTLAAVVLERMARPGARKNDLYELKLLIQLAPDPVRERAVARRALRRSTDMGRACASWVATNQVDRRLMRQVADQIFRAVTNSGSHRDRAVLADLSHDDEVGPEILERLRGLPPRHILLYLAAEGELSDTWAKDPIFSGPAMAEAYRFESSFLNTPREGQLRALQIDPEIGGESFDEGLRRGGRASEGVAESAMARHPAQTIATILRRFGDVTKKKVRDDLGRALRGAPDLALVKQSLLERLGDESEPKRLAALELAGWIASPGLLKAMKAILVDDPRHELQSAVDAALARSDRLTFSAALMARLDAEDGPFERRRLIALAIDMDEDRVLLNRGDPLYLGDRIRGDREWCVATHRAKS